MELWSDADKRRMDDKAEVILMPRAGGGEAELWSSGRMRVAPSFAVRNCSRPGCRYRRGRRFVIETITDRRDACRRSYQSCPKLPTD